QVLLHIPFKYPARCHRMNNEGSWIGTFADSTTKEVHGIYWTKQQGYTVLRHFSPVAFNAHGQIVGYLLKGNQVKAPALWYRGTTYDLNALLKFDQDLSSPWQSLIKVTGINTQGQIVGQGIFGHQVHACLLNPK
ncbi:MAG: hypothetical protein KDK65_02455, partial [Chlamydiia bacterium]|nr:hypothetical protein [Chlamydiia bacterium]